MSNFQIFLLAFLLSIGMFVAATSLVSGMKELIIVYLDKKKEAIEELEKKFAKPGVAEPSGPQRWTA